MRIQAAALIVVLELGLATLASSARAADTPPPLDCPVKKGVVVITNQSLPVPPGYARVRANPTGSGYTIEKTVAAKDAEKLAAKWAAFLGGKKVGDLKLGKLERAEKSGGVIWFASPSRKVGNDIHYASAMVTYEPGQDQVTVRLSVLWGWDTTLDVVIEPEPAYCGRAKK